MAKIIAKGKKDDLRMIETARHSSYLLWCASNYCKIMFTQHRKGFANLLLAFAWMNTEHDFMHFWCIVCCRCENTTHMVPNGLDSQRANI